MLKASTNEAARYSAILVAWQKYGTWSQVKVLPDQISMVDSLLEPLSIMLHLMRCDDFDAAKKIKGETFPSEEQQRSRLVVLKAKENLKWIYIRGRQGLDEGRLTKIHAQLPGYPLKSFPVIEHYQWQREPAERSSSSTLVACDQDIIKRCEQNNDGKLVPKPDILRYSHT